MKKKDRVKQMSFFALALSLNSDIENETYKRQTKRIILIFYILCLVGACYYVVRDMSAISSLSLKLWHLVFAVLSPELYVVFHHMTNHPFLEELDDPPDVQPYIDQLAQFDLPDNLPDDLPNVQTYIDSKPTDSSKSLLNGFKGVAERLKKSPIRNDFVPLSMRVFEN